MGNSTHKFLIIIIKNIINYFTDLYIDVPSFRSKIWNFIVIFYKPAIVDYNNL